MYCIGSKGLLRLLRVVVRLDWSSTREGAPRVTVSFSTCSLTVAGPDAALLAIFGRFWALDGVVRGVDTVVMEEALDECGMLEESDVMAAEEVMVDVWTSEDMVDSKVELVAPVSSRGDAEGFEVALGAVGLFLEAASWPSTSSASWTAVLLTALTASLKRLYRPLSPCWTRSPAVPLFSTTVPGGDAKSLKVVRASDRLADV